ncbi:MAG: hypothetical protein ABI648_09260 [Betaproteobacteria bacterium]
MKTWRLFGPLTCVVVSMALMGSASAVQGNDAGTIDANGVNARSSQPPGPTASWFDRIDINVYGLAYHPDREAVHRLNLDNQVNPGLGLHYALVDDLRGTTFAEVGTYRDSGRNQATFAELGYQFKLSERWRIGAALALVESRTYNGGTTFLGMIPLITYDLGPLKLNAVYFPKIGHYNEVAAYGFYLSIPLQWWLR